jgi:23S rRNA pseudouridine2605 synthase
VRVAAGNGLTSPEPGERLQKVLAQAGLGSRRLCELMVTEGRVTVNGQVAHIGQRAEPAHDHITIDGIPLPVREGLVYYLLNKPAGVICTAADPQGRPSALDLVPTVPRVFTVGRLDVDSAGLIVVTNDGDLAYHLTHPAFGVEKEYVVEVEGALSRDAVSRLRRGVELDDGMTAPASVHLLRPDAARVVLHEGRKRQVRRMCEAVGHPVRSLARTRVGPVSDPQLASGHFRSLTTAEVMDLWGAASRGQRGTGTGAKAGRGGRSR